MKVYRCLKRKLDSHKYLVFNIITIHFDVIVELYQPIDTYCRYKFINRNPAGKNCVMVDRKHFNFYN